MRLLLIFFFSSCLSLPCWAQDPGKPPGGRSQLSTRQKRTETLEKKRRLKRALWLKKQQKNQTEVQVEESPSDETKASAPAFLWFGSFGYGLRTDLADQVKPRIYTHSLNLNAGFNYHEKTSVYGKLGVSYESLGEQNSEINVSSNNSELFVGNFTLGGSYSFSFLKNNTASVSLENEFPTSPDAQREGIGSVTSLSASVSRSFFSERLSLSLLASQMQIWHSYYYSYATGQINKEGGSSLGISSALKVWRELRLSVMAGAMLSRYKDSTTDLNYRNALGVSYGWGSLSANLSFSSGSYLEGPEEATLWYIDEYRRIIGLGLNYRF